MVSPIFPAPWLTRKHHISQACATTATFLRLYRSSSLVEIVPASPHLPGRSWDHSLPKTPLLSLQPWNPSFPPSVFPSPKHASLAPLDQLFFCLFHSSGRGKDCVYFLKCLIYPINESMNEWMKWMFTSCWVKSKFLKDFIQVCGWDAGSLEMPGLFLWAMVNWDV